MAGSTITRRRFVARVCVRCGSVMGEDFRFCVQCGMAVVMASPPFHGPTSVAPPRVQGAEAALGRGLADSGSGVLKIVAWILAVSALVTLMSIGSCAYFDYRARKSKMGLPRATYTHRTPGGVPVPPLNPREVCSLVSNEEVGQALGTTVSSTNMGTSGCHYTSSVGKSLTVDITPRGGSLALQLSAMAMKGSRGGGAVHKLMGIGDEAYVGRKGSTLMFRKGDTLVNLEVHADGNSFRAAVVIARKIATRVQ